MDIIKRLNELRLERNLSVYRLAELSGLNQSTLANIFSRGTIPSIHTLEAVCDTLGITLAQFFTENENVTILTSEEQKLIKCYQQLPHDVKQAIINIVTSIAQTKT